MDFSLSLSSSTPTIGDLSHAGVTTCTWNATSQASVTITEIHNYLRPFELASCFMVVCHATQSKEIKCFLRSVKVAISFINSNIFYVGCSHKSNCFLDEDDVGRLLLCTSDDWL